MALFKRWHPSTEEIHTYIVDLKRITELRNNCSRNPQEQERYNNIIHVMQEVLLILTSPPKQ